MRKFHHFVITICDSVAGVPDLEVWDLILVTKIITRSIIVKLEKMVNSLTENEQKRFEAIVKNNAKFLAFRLDAHDYMSCKVCKNRRLAFKDKWHLEHHLKSDRHKNYDYQMRISHRYRMLVAETQSSGVMTKALYDHYITDVPLAEVKARVRKDERIVEELEVIPEPDEAFQPKVVRPEKNEIVEEEVEAEENKNEAVPKKDTVLENAENINVRTWKAYQSCKHSKETIIKYDYWVGIFQRWRSRSDLGEKVCNSDII